jgi:hypothetical protein
MVGRLWLRRRKLTAFRHLVAVRAKHPCGEDRLSRRCVGRVVSLGIPTGVGMTTPRGGVTTPSSLSFRAGRSVARAKNPCGEDRLSRRSVGRVVSLGIPPGVGMTTLPSEMTTLPSEKTTAAPWGCPASLRPGGRRLYYALTGSKPIPVLRKCSGTQVSHGGILDRDPNSLSR